jgi:hypothetical protein
MSWFRQQESQWQIQDWGICLIHLCYHWSQATFFTCLVDWQSRRRQSHALCQVASRYLYQCQDVPIEHFDVGLVLWIP